MELDQIKEMYLEGDTPIEVCHKDEEENKCFDLVYFIRTIEKLPELWRQGHEEPPYIEVAFHKNKNGCLREFKEFKLEDILGITKLEYKQ